MSEHQSEREPTQLYRFAISDEIITVSGLLLKDKYPLIGPAGMSIIKVHPQTGVSVSYAVKGVRAINVSADVAEDSVVILTDGRPETAAAVEAWLQKRFEDLYTARTMFEKVLKSHRSGGKPESASR